MTNFTQPEPALQSALILLAAGNSTRMGSPKQLLDFRGQPMLRHAALTALASGCNPVIVVLGAQNEEIRPALHGLNVEVIINPRWEQGMGTSIHAGLIALEKVLEKLGAQNQHPLGVILTLADQPFITPAFLCSLIDQHRQTCRPIVAAQYSGTVGVPAFFASQFFPSLMALNPGEGSKKIIQAHPGDTLLIDCPQAAQDIDTPEDYVRNIL
jgi:molybdenum cofactor cytidylyltransferase